jgi:oligoendopeptidase F
MKYDSYYDYASEMLYVRDATAAEREAFRTYVANYILPLYLDLAQKFDTLYDSLSYADQMRVYNLLFEAYDDQSKDYVADYIASYPLKVRQNFESMFDSESSIWTDSSDAYEGAYTTYLYDEERPFCFFGPGYQTPFTVVHEMGHYYAGCFNSISDIPLDLAEVHSQANEYLFLRSLEDALSTTAYRSLMLYQLLDTAATIILSTVIDDFEEYVYDHYDQIVANGTSLDDIMEMICEDYGGLTMLTEQVADMNLYWKYVVLDSPVYYISYALSATTALSIFEISTDDEDAARTIYRELAEELDVTLAFREILEDAGLPDPYAQSTFEAIRNIIS